MLYHDAELVRAGLKLKKGRVMFRLHRAPSVSFHVDFTSCAMHLTEKAAEVFHIEPHQTNTNY